MSIDVSAPSIGAKVETLLRVVVEEERDQLFPLLKEGPAVVEQLIGKRSARAVLHRWASRGVAGVRLETVSVGSVRFSTRRMLFTFWAEVDAAKVVAADEKRKPAPESGCSEEEEAVLHRHEVQEAHLGTNLTQKDEATLRKHGTGRKS